MKKRIILVIMTVLMLWLLPGGVALAVTFGFNTEEATYDNILTDTNDAYKLQVYSSTGSDVVTNYSATIANFELTTLANPSLIDGLVVYMASADLATKPTGTIIVGLESGKPFILNSFVCANKYGSDNLSITTGSTTETFLLPNNTNTTITPSSAFAGITSFTLSWTNSSEGYFDNFNITPVTTPVIKTQPSNVTVASGNNTSFSVAAIGNVLTYQWQVDTTGSGTSFANVSNGGVYSGATSTSLSITGVTPGMNHYLYRCLVTNDGTYTATSNSAALTFPALSPTDITLGNTSIAENTASGTKVGDLSSTDPDSSLFTYSLVSGIGDTDNASFSILGSELRLNMVPNFENKSSYNIRIQTEDEAGLTYSKPFTVAITDVNEAPTNIILSSTSIAENSASGTTIGTLTGTDPDAGASLSYTLPAGLVDNDSFTLTGNTLILNMVPDFEADNSFNIMAHVSDGTYLYDKAFTITITNVNEAPTGLNISNSSILEHSAAGTTIGTFSGIDPDAGVSFTYSLVSGAGDTDNASFSINTADLRSAFVPDFETKNSYTIRVRVSDGYLTFEQSFTITILDGNDPPADITLTGGSFAENAALGAEIGTFVTTDNAGDTFTYTLAAGTGDADNASFTLAGDVLVLNASTNYEIKNSYSIRIRSMDNHGLYSEKVFTISVTNVNEAPTDITLSNNSIAENSAIGTTIGTLTGTDPDAGTTFVYSLPAVGDYAGFTISGNSLKLAAVPDYEIKNTYNITVRVSDGALNYDKAFTINITNAPDAPTDIVLTGSSVLEHCAIGTTIGTLSSTDQEGGAFTYSLASGIGATDNTSFSLSGNTLQINVSPDYEVKNSYSIRIRTTDSTSLYYEKVLTINVTDGDDPPTDITISNHSIAENSAIGTTIGTLSSTDTDGTGSYTYSFTTGSGDTDNASFTLTGDILKLAVVPNYEVKNSYTIRIRTTDETSFYFDKAITITITNVNEAPTDISLSGTSVPENVAAGTTVGTLTGTDPDAGTAFTYTLAAGAGDTDNASFTISSNVLKLAAVPDYETKSSYTIRVRVSDGALTFEKPFTITVTDGNDAPANIVISGDSVNENTASGTTLAILSSTDPDSLSFIYTLVAGSGSTDNASFIISGNELKLAIEPNYEGKSNYNIRIRTTDDEGLSFEKAFVITITDINEEPTNLALSKNSINENSAAGTTVGTLSGTDADAGSSFTYSLVSGTGDIDNSAFNITGNVLKSALVFDFNTKSSYDIRIRVTDAGGLYYEKSFTIAVNKVINTPPSPQTTIPSVETITLDVTNGTTENSVAKIEVERTTTSDGIIKDSITFGKQKAAESIEKLADENAKAVRLVAPVAKDKVAEVKVNIPTESLDLLSDTELSLELETENVRISIANASIETASEEMEEDLYFRLTPMTEEEKKQDLTERASKNGMLVQLLGEDIAVIGRPMEIETNMPHTTVDIVLPLTDIVIPKDDKEKEELLSKLAVYVEHSDGEKEVIRGEIVLYRDGVYGLKFSVSKFSTFTIVKDGSVKSNQCEIMSVITPAKTSIDASLLKAKVKYNSTTSKVNITVSKGATWKLYSDKACTKVISGKVKLKSVLTKVYIKVIAEDGVSYKIHTLYIIRSKAVK